MIVVVPFNTADQLMAERLMDACYWIGGCKPQGHCLLVPGPDVHQEYKFKVRLAAEVAFSSVDVFELPSVNGETKIQKINSVFKQAARYVQECYKHPWLWLEVDNVPLRPGWMLKLFSAYHNQPKRYMGRHMQGKNQVFMSRTGIYPADAIHELDGACNNQAPFERVANILPRTASTPLIHMEKWDGNLAYPEGPVLLNRDRSGKLIEQLIEEANEPKARKTRKAA